MSKPVKTESFLHIKPVISQVILLAEKIPKDEKQVAYNALEGMHKFIEELNKGMPPEEKALFDYLVTEISISELYSVQAIMKLGRDGMQDILETNPDEIIQILSDSITRVDTSPEIIAHTIIEKPLVKFLKNGRTILSNLK